MEVENVIVEVPVDSLKPDTKQPRKTFPTEEIESMAQTIKAQGTINAIEVDENNVIITGEIRWRGAKKAGVRTVPIRRIRHMTPTERLERQLIENLHHYELTSVERENAIYKLWKTGQYKSLRELANVLGYTHTTINAIIEAREFRDRVGRLPSTTPTSLISETQGLDDQTRVKILEKTTHGEIRRPAPQTEIRRAVKVVKEAPEPVKKKFLEGELPLEKAAEITEIAKEAPEPLKKAIVKDEVEPERAKKAIELYQKLKDKGVELEPSRISLHVEELRKEARVSKAQERLRTETYKELLTGKKEAVDTLFVERSRMFLNDVKDVAWKVKGWGVPQMMQFGAKTWEEAQKYFKQIHDHTEFLLRASPTDKGKRDKE